MSPLGFDRKSRVNRFFTRMPDRPKYAGDYARMAGGGVGAGVSVGAFIAGATPGDAVYGGLLCMAPLFLCSAIVAVAGAFMFLEKRARYREDYARAYPKPSVDWIRSLLYQDLKRIERRALASLGIDSDDLQLESEASIAVRRAAIIAGQISDDDTEKHPVIIVGPAWKTRAARDPANGNYIFEHCAISMVCPTASSFSIFECTLYLDTGTCGIERTFQYPYSHVAVVATVTIPLWEIRKRKRVQPLEFNFEATLSDLAYQYLEVEVSSGNSAKLSCGVFNQTSRATTVSDFSLDFEAATEAVRAALRKQGVFGN